MLAYRGAKYKYSNIMKNKINRSEFFCTQPPVFESSDCGVIIHRQSYKREPASPFSWQPWHNDLQIERQRLKSVFLRQRCDTTLAKENG